MSREGNVRQQIISEFAEMTIDMDYMLCIPSVHAKYKSENAIVSIGGGIREKSEQFPDDKAKMLVDWVRLHRKEIEENHARLGSGEDTLIKIEPYQ